MTDITHPTRTQALSARENQERAAALVRSCAYCEPSPTEPGVTTYVCPDCEVGLDKEILAETCVEKGVPYAVAQGLARYVHDRIPPGSFLRCVLENNLDGAVFWADPDSLAALKDIVLAIRWETPAGCHGSPEAVRKWLDQRRAP